MRAILILLFFFFSSIAKGQLQQDFFWLLNSSCPGFVDDTYSKPLDGQPAMAAYGLRKLSSTYSGPLLRVRRSTDNTQVDVYATANGNLDVCAYFGFVGSGNGYITTWYDQSGNGMDAVQATTSIQPQLILNVQNGKPAILFDVSALFSINSTSYFNNFHQGQGSVTVAARAGMSSDPNAIYGIVGTNSGTNSNVGYSLFYDDRVISSSNNALRVSASNGGSAVISDIAQNSVTPNTFRLINSTVNVTLSGAARSTSYVNNIALTGTNSASGAASGSNATYNMQIGALGNNGFRFAGYMTEVIFHNTKLNSTDLNSINSNINSYYNIY